MPIHPFVSRNAEVACRQDQQAITSMGVKAEREPCLVSFFHYQFSIFFSQREDCHLHFYFPCSDGFMESGICEIK